MRRIGFATLAACLGLFGALPAAHAAKHQIIGAQLNGANGQPKARIVPGKNGRPVVQDLGTAKYLQTKTVNINLGNHTKGHGTFPAHGGAFSSTHEFQRVNLRHGRQAVVISAADSSTRGEAARGTEHAMVVVGTENVGVVGEGYLAKPPIGKRVQPGYGVVGVKLSDPSKPGRVLVAPAGHSGTPDMQRARVIELAPRAPIGQVRNALGQIAGELYDVGRSGRPKLQVFWKNGARTAVPKVAQTREWGAGAETLLQTRGLLQSERVKPGTGVLFQRPGFNLEPSVYTIVPTARGAAAKLGLLPGYGINLAIAPK